MENLILSRLEAKFRKLENKLLEIEGSELTAAIHGLTFAELVDMQDYDEIQLQRYMYTESLKDNFKDRLLSQYSRLNLNQARYKLLEQSVILHRDSAFAGSVLLLYSQIEGIITDALSKARFLRPEGRSFIEMNQGIERLNKKNSFIYVNGLDRKIELSKNFDADMSKFFESMSSAELVFDDPESKIVRDRNKILHGEDVSFWMCNKRSTQLIWWLYGLVYKLQDVEF